MSKKRFFELLDLYKAGRLDPEQEREWVKLLDLPEYRKWLGQAIENDFETSPVNAGWTGDRKLQVLQQVRLYTGMQEPVRTKSIFLRPHWWIAAAACLLVIGSRVYFPATTSGPVAPAKPIAQTIVKHQDVLPGGNHAVLTLSSGARIVLDSAANGLLAEQGNVNIKKLASGQIAYAVSDVHPSEPLYNTLTTPCGGQYQLLLPDGSRVWLNSSSSITYPTYFSGGERKVEITGEAYLEVIHNPKLPFRVVTAGQTIEDLGTSFNVNAYLDESDIKVTLLEGSIALQSAILKPGQQARIKTNNKIEIINRVDLTQVIAWKNGIFNFNKADLKTVLRQLSRWYDVTVEYEGQAPSRVFGGEMQRDLTLSQILKQLESMNLHFQIEGKKIIVKK